MHNQTKAYHGFTIVELLIVIVVIAILAAITIVAYNGITKRSSETTLQSDLKNSATILNIDKVRDGVFPSSSSAANGGMGLKASAGNTLDYQQTAYGFCLNGTNTKTTKVLRFRSDTGQIDEGLCQPIVSTLAGSGALGSADGPGGTASFKIVTGVTVDTNGTVYVADSNNHTIRKVTASGVVTTLAGLADTSGYADGTGSAARFSLPNNLTVDSSGTLYVADPGNHRIRKVSPSGVVTTLAGSGSASYADGTGTAASFSYPMDITLDSSGNLYVADTGNSRIRKVTPAGVVTTFAGSGTYSFADGTGTAAHFRQPYGISSDSSNNLYVADTENHRIRKITPLGVVTTIAGSGTAGYADGSAASARFNQPMDTAVDNTGSVYIADRYTQRIRKIALDGTVSTYAGTGTSGFANGTASVAQFDNPVSVAIDASGTMYIADYSNYMIRKISQ